MAVIFILGISILLQFTAAGLALRLIKITGKRLGWILISIAILLMAIRRCITLSHLLSDQIPIPPDLMAETVALVISICMAAGMGLIAPYFLTLRKSRQKLSESNKSLEKEIEGRKQFEEKLRASQKALQDIFDHTTDMIFTIDLKTKKIIHANRQVTKILGYSQEEILSLSAADLHPSEMPQLESFFLTVSEKKSHMTDELHCRTKSGSFIPTEISASMIGDAENPCIAAFVRDISAKKRAEEERDAYRMDLERSNKDLEEFAHHASHDLQEPLRKIVSFGDLLKGRLPDKDPKGIDYLERMQKAASRMKNLIHDLMEYSRATSKKTAKEPVDLNTLIEAVLEDLEYEIENKKATVNKGELPVLELDSFQFQKVFQNLISNAIKYQPSGQSPVISINSFYSESAGRWQIVVTDNGIGIEEKNFSRIFRPFERLHVDSAYKGTGIGLAICEKVVSRHNGEISVSSVLGKGTTFTIALPEKSAPER